MPGEKKKYLSIEEISAYCKVPVQTVIRWISKGIMGANLKKKDVSLEDFISFLHRNEFPRKEESAHSTPKVLVIDDEADVANTIGDTFLVHGFNVAISKDVIEAGCFIKSERPQIVTVDLGMNTFDGLDLIKIINGLNCRQKIWIVVISGRDEEELKSAVGMGADCYLQKPYSNDDLERIINKFFPAKNKLLSLKAS